MAFSGEIEKLERRWQENPLGLTFAPLAEAYRKAGDPVRALQLLEQGLAQHPNYVPAHIVRGRCHLDTQSDPDAELAFLRVTELDPENVIALKGLAELSERSGRLPEALHRLGLLLDVDRNNEEARGQLDRVRDLMATRAEAVAEAAPAPVAESSPPVAEPVPAAEPDLVFQEPEYHRSAATVSTTPEAIVPEPPSRFDDDSLHDIELEVASRLNSAPSDEFQIPNDSEMLRPSGQRIEDLVLGSESQEDVPGGDADFAAESAPRDPLAETGVDSVDALLGDQYASLMAFRDASPPPEVPLPFEETIFDQISLIPEAPVPVTDVLPPPPPPPPPVQPESFLPPSPEPEPEPEPAPAMEAVPVAQSAAPTEPAPVAEPVAAEREPEHPSWSAAAETPALPTEPAPEPESEKVDGFVPLGDLGAPTRYEPAPPVQAEEPEPSAPEEPELVVTETMAEIFLRQGHRELALAVYVQLAQREPDNERIAAALARLAPESSPPPAPAPEPLPRFAASDTGGRSVGELFRSLLSASRPTPASAIHPPAFEQPKRSFGEPTRPAQESLSLSTVFGDDAAPAGPVGPPSEGSPGEPSFDEFFAPATGSSANTELPHAPDSTALPAQVPEDLEQFNAWLRGLKR